MKKGMEVVIGMMQSVPHGGEWRDPKFVVERARELCVAYGVDPEDDCSSGQIENLHLIADRLQLVVDKLDEVVQAVLTSEQ